MVNIKLAIPEVSHKQSTGLLVLAPGYYREILQEHFPGAIIKNCESPDFQALQNAIGSRKKVKSILLIVKGNRAPAKVMPTPLFHGIPVGILPCLGVKGLKLWLNSLQRRNIHPTNTISVLSMWKAFYMRWSNNFFKSLKKGFAHSSMTINKWFANEIERKVLCERISEGASLLLYAGHGRSRGWTGYRGVRWKHIAAVPMQEPVGSVICLTCSNLQVARHNRIPFGVQWVRSGRACAFLGAVSGVYVDPLKKVAHILNNCFENGELSTIGNLMRHIDLEVKRINDEALTACWNDFRLIGNPDEVIFHGTRSPQSPSH